MKKIFVFCLFVLTFFSLSSFCLASPEEGEDFSYPSSEEQTEDLSQDIIIDDSVSGREVINSLISALADKESTSKDLPDDIVITDVTVKSLNPITPGSTSGLKSALLGVLGNYDAVVVEYQYQNNNGTYSYLREVQPDYVWLCSAAIILVFIFCLFRIGGSALSKR